MKRLGKYTGKIYNENDNVKECTILITEKQATDDKFVKLQHIACAPVCIRCGGCGNPLLNSDEN